MGKTAKVRSGTLKRVQPHHHDGRGESSKSRKMTAGTPLKDFESVFVHSLSKSTSSSKNAAYKVQKKKNRMGQNARKRVWELLYQGKANHMFKRKRSSAKQETGLKAAVRQPKIEFKSKDQAVGSGGGGESTLHPSWEASKKKKLLESATFQGQRTIFADSD